MTRGKIVPATVIAAMREERDQWEAVPIVDGKEILNYMACQKNEKGNIVYMAEDSVGHLNAVKWFIADRVRRAGRLQAWVSEE